jgi:hypothetical protein
MLSATLLSDRLFFLAGGGEGDSRLGETEAEGERRFFFLHIRKIYKIKNIKVIRVTAANLIVAFH